MFCNNKEQMNAQYLNIFCFLYYQKMVFLYNDINAKKPKKLTLLSQIPYNNVKPNLSSNIYKWQFPVYNNYSHVNKYIKNKL